MYQKIFRLARGPPVEKMGVFLYVTLK
jgi:hypothetical protein